MTFSEFENKLKEIGFKYQDYVLNESDKMKFYFKYDKKTAFELVEKDSKRYNELVFKGVLYGYEREPIYVPKNRNIANELYSFFIITNKEGNKYSLDFISILDEFKSLEEKECPIMVPIFEMTEEEFGKILESNKLKEWFDNLEEKSKNNIENLDKHLEYYRSAIDKCKDCVLEHEEYGYYSKFKLVNDTITISITDNIMTNISELNIKNADITDKSNADQFIKIVKMMVKKIFEYR